MAFFHELFSLYQSDSADPKSANYMIVEQFVDSEMSKSGGGSSEIVSGSRKPSVEIGQKERSPSHQTEYGKKYLNVSPVKLQDSSSYRIMNYLFGFRRLFFFHF